MDIALDEQARYYELRLQDCERRPGIHREQIRALRRHLGLARAADTVEEYMASTDQFDLAHAESLDRHRVELAVHRTLGNAGKQRGAELMLEAVQKARTVASMWTRVATASAAVHSRRVRETVCAHEVARVVVAILEWAPEAHPVMAKMRLQDLIDRWATLTRYDPGCDWQRVADYAPYRRRVPFDDAGMNSLGVLLDAALRGAVTLGMTPAPGGVLPAEPAAPEYAEEPPAPPAPERAGDAPPYDPRSNPSVAEIAAGYHAHYDSLDPVEPGMAATRRVYERMFELEREADTVPAFYRALTQERITAKLAAAEHVARARDALTRCLPRAHPYLEHHHSLVATRLVACRTNAEVEFELLVAEECLDVEADWNEVLLACATRPLRAAIRFGMHRDDMSTKTTVDSLRLTLHLLGCDWPGLMAAPRVDTFLRSELFERGQRFETGAENSFASPDYGARRGHAGMHVVAELRNAVGEQAAAGGMHPDDRLFSTADALVNHLIALVEEAHGGAPPGAPRRDALHLWETPVALGDCLDAALSPPRPVVDLDALA